MQQYELFVQHDCFAAESIVCYPACLINNWLSRRAGVRTYCLCGKEDGDKVLGGQSSKKYLSSEKKAKKSLHLLQRVFWLQALARVVSTELYGFGNEAYCSIIHRYYVECCFFRRTKIPENIDTFTSMTAV